ncbi:hypothetical protein Tco_0697034 [Tanacetum coccineum]
MQVLDQNVEEEVKDTRFVVMEGFTFKQIIDEVDLKTQGAQENAESPFDTESEIKIIKSYQAATISGSLFINPSSLYDQDQNVINITPKDAKEGEASKSLSGLRYMPDDDLASLSTQSDPLGHLQEELNLLNNKVDQLETSISKKVVDDIQSSIPTILEISFTSEGAEQIPSYQNEEIHQTEDLKVMFKDMVSLLEAAEVFKKANAEGEKEKPSAQVVPNKEKDLVVHNPEEKKSEGK